MNISFLAIKVTPKGRLVPAVVGQPNEHIMDRRGCNFRVLNLPRWKRGKTLENTSTNRILLQSLLNAVDKDAVQAIAGYSKGAGLGEYDYQFVDLSKEERGQLRTRRLP